MTEEEWLAAARSVAREQSQSQDMGFAALRLALAKTCLLMLDAPTRITDAYYDLPEEVLAEGGEAILDRLDQGDWRWRLEASSTTTLARDLGIRARGLDLALNYACSNHGPSDEPDQDYFCSTAQAYVVPRQPRPWVEGHGSRRFFRRRGAPLHRVIPKAVGSFVQKLHRLDVVATSPGAERPLGAAMFQNFRLLHEADGTELRILGVECDDAVSRINAHIDAARAAGCQAVVWPELTMPPAHLEALVQRLEYDAFSASSARGPDWVVAASWNAGDPLTNVAPILDRQGSLVFGCEKSIPYRETGLGREAICGAFQVPILITDQHLIAFAICRDFCELAQQTPWSALNVDLVVVPSMGEVTTMQSHRTVADAGWALGQRSFVVQQRDATSDAKPGWVLPPNKRPGGLEISGMEADAWSEHRLP